MKISENGKIGERVWPIGPSILVSIIIVIVILEPNKIKNQRVLTLWFSSFYLKLSLAVVKTRMNKRNSLSEEAPYPQETYKCGRPHYL